MTRRSRLLVFLVVLVLVVGAIAVRHGARTNRGRARATPDSVRRDSTATGDSPPVVDPPCFASKLGLPCQS